MATAILHSIRQGAYIAIALYVVFIAVVTVTSMNPPTETLVHGSSTSSWVDARQAAANAPEHAS
ncbi:hypothetical protein KDX38_02675 [Pseudomonas sp. CDFA 602]|uniref:hypothetical protein n=1 Tax=Pseudomonas californiensis TaxID=2829823 RepID=UPI001E36F78E|nr:hypothetical protein [Pseudomonas californiensis]MCD5992598.1 hypothetical protein [Pseudomonas californiensis]MCD5998124.1 hypothetical protein [Pseudomonas californiensis]